MFPTQMALSANSTGTAPQHHPITSRSCHPLGFCCMLVIWTNTVCVVVLVEIRLRTQLKWLSRMMLKLTFVLCVAKFKEHHSVYVLPFVVVSVCRYESTHVCARACVYTSPHACVHMCLSLHWTVFVFQSKPAMFFRGPPPCGLQWVGLHDSSRLCCQAR